MLVQLDKLEGVKDSSTNTTGTLVRIEVAESADSLAVVADLESLFEDQGRKATRLLGDDLATALKDEEWRDANRVGELSEIEFRTVFSRRVKRFTETASLEQDIADKLVKLSNEVLEETPASAASTDWSDFCNGLATTMLDKAADVLSEEQIGELKQVLQANIQG